MADIVRPVPGRKPVQIVGEGVEFFGVVRIYHCLEEILETGDACQLEIHEYGVIIFSPHGTVACGGSRRLVADGEFQTVQNHVPAYAVVCLQKVHYAVDDRLLILFPGGGIGSLVGVDVGVVQRCADIEVIFAEVLLRQPDGFFFVKSFGIALIPQRKEEIVTVSLFEFHAAFYGGHRFGE